MIDENPDQESAVRAALGRYADRFPPVETEWARVEARYRVALRQGKPRRIVLISMPALIAAAVMVVAFGLTRPETAGPPGSPEAHFVEAIGAGTPQYAAVVPVPVFAAGTTPAAIQARGKLRVGIKFDQPNFGVRDAASGEVQGFDAEIAKLIAVGIFGGSVTELGDRIQWVEAVSANRESMLEDGAVDLIIATYSITPLRSQRVDFAGPYFRARQDLMIRADDPSIRSVEDLAGKRVCTARGSTSYQNLMRHSPSADAVLRDTYSECAKALSDREVDAVTTDQPILAGYAHQSGGVLKVLNNPFSDELYGIGVPKGDDGLRSFLNDRLNQIVANGDWNRAARTSLSDIESIPPPIG